VKYVFVVNGYFLGGVMLQVKVNYFLDFKILKNCSTCLYYFRTLHMTTNCEVHIWTKFLLGDIERISTAITRLTCISKRLGSNLSRVKLSILVIFRNISKLLRLVPEYWLNTDDDLFIFIWIILYYNLRNWCSVVKHLKNHEDEIWICSFYI
jgi:hypothetical protein